jgi:hypothetical protein
MKKVYLAAVLCICIFIAGIIVMSMENPLGEDAAVRHADRTGVEYTQVQVDAFVYTMIGCLLGLPVIAAVAFLVRAIYRAWKDYQWINGRGKHDSRAENKRVHLHDSASGRVPRERKKPD